MNKYKFIIIAGISIVAIFFYRNVRQLNLESSPIGLKSGQASFLVETEAKNRVQKDITRCNEHYKKYNMSSVDKCERINHSSIDSEIYFFNENKLKVSGSFKVWKAGTHHQRKQKFNAFVILDSSDNLEIERISLSP